VRSSQVVYHGGRLIGGGGGTCTVCIAGPHTGAVALLYTLVHVWQRGIWGGLVERRMSSMVCLAPDSDRGWALVSLWRWPIGWSRQIREVDGALAPEEAFWFRRRRPRPAAAHSRIPATATTTPPRRPSFRTIN